MDIHERTVAGMNAERVIFGSREVGRYATRVRIVSEASSFNGRHGVVVRVDRESGTLFVRVHDRGCLAVLPFARSEVEVLMA